MKKINAKNERIKREYFRYLEEADGKNTATIDGIRKSLHRFEEYNHFKDFGTFNREQASAFKKHLASQKAERTGEALSKSTLLSTLNHLKAFLKWLSYQPGYRSKIHLPDIDYFNLSDKEARIARTPKFKDCATLDQIRKAIFSMPVNTDIAKRDRAIMAFTILTGMRDSAIVSLKLKHIDLERELVKQDPNEVNTKGSKRIDTYFFPVGDDIKQVVLDWMHYLLKDKLYGYDMPVFPRTALSHNADYSFQAAGLEPVYQKVQYKKLQINSHLLFSHY